MLNVSKSVYEAKNKKKRKFRIMFPFIFWFQNMVNQIKLRWALFAVLVLLMLMMFSQTDYHTQSYKKSIQLLDR